MDDRQWSREPVLIVGLGGTLFLIAAVHHGLEIAALDGSAGPILALALDGIPALGIVYAGYRLAGTDLAATYRRTIGLWALIGGVIFVTVIGASFLVRVLEGRTIVEWQFPLLIAADIGVLSGLVAGYYHVRAKAETREARTVSQALGFVNSLLRHDLRNDLATIQGHAELLDDDQGGASASADPSVIIDKAEEAVTRIETTRSITDTVVDEPDVEPIELAGPRSSRCGSNATRYSSAAFSGPQGRIADSQSNGP